MRYLYLILSTLVLVSCGVRGNHFKIEGKFRNLNQGEFYVYSPDGGVEGIDTIHVQGGEFAYEVPLDKPATFVLVFPNFSEQPVFGAPGVTAELKGDASHLKELEVSGSDENELMTNFSKQILHSSPPEAVKAAVGLIKENPSSLVSDYLLNKYFLQTSTPDYRTALNLIDLLIKNQKGNGHLIQLKSQVEGLCHGLEKAKLPRFSAKNMDGALITDNELKGKYCVINVWASWNFDSQSLQRQIQSLKRKLGSRMTVLSINMDVSKVTCREILNRDSIRWNNICDEKAWNSPLVKTFGITTVPDNFIVSPDGRIIARNLDMTALKERVETLLK
jgi:hypothetical protein